MSRGPCVAERLRYYRKARQLTQEQLAHEVGCTRVAITQFERGTTCPSVTVLLRLKTVLHVPTIEDLLQPCDCHHSRTSESRP